MWTTEGRISRHTIAVQHPKRKIRLSRVVLAAYAIVGAAGIVDYKVDKVCS